MLYSSSCATVPVVAEVLADISYGFAVLTKILYVFVVYFDGSLR